MNTSSFKFKAIKTLAATVCFGHLLAILACGQDTRLTGLGKRINDEGLVVEISYIGTGDALVMALRDEEFANYLGSVSRVRLEQHAITAKEIESLSLLRSFKTLHLGEFPDFVTVSQDAINELANLASVEFLYVYASAPMGTQWEALGQMNSLRVLTLDGDFVLSENDLDAIARLSKLESLRIHNQASIDDFEWLADLSQLISVSIVADELGTGVWNALQLLPNIEKITLRGAALDAESIGGIEESTKLRLTHVEFELLDADALSQMSSFPNLESLVANLPMETECDLSFVSGLPKLKWMVVRGCASMEKEAIESMEHPTLERIRLTDVNGTNAVLFRRFEDR